MNLIRGDLEKYGFRTVWFNAWHHQREENLFAALLESLRQHAAPTLLEWHPRTLRYQAKLWLRKIRTAQFSRSVLWMSAWLLLLLLIIRVPPHELLALLVNDAAELAERSGADEWLKLVLAGLAGTAGGTQLFAVIQRLRAFTVHPAELLLSKSRTARLADLERQTSMRFRFAREFHDFCEAFKPRNLVVFIDDLDRCNPQTVAMTLECVNYLVSCGDCYIILGVDYTRVRNCVAQQYAGEAQTLIRLTGETESATALGDFADRYLEKLINLRIDLPVSSFEQRAALLRVDDQANGVRRNVPRRRAGWMSEWSGRAAMILPPGLIVALMALTAVGIGYWRSFATSTAAPVASVPPESSSAPAPPRRDAAAAFSMTRTQDFGYSPRDRTLLESNPESLVAVQVLWLILGLGSTYLLGILVLELMTPDTGVLRDSSRFKRALRHWLPILEQRVKTPRALKRFVNEIRYRAMLQQRPLQKPTVLEYLSAILRRSKSAPAASTVPVDEAIPEDQLVGLCAARRCLAQWPSNAEEFQDEVRRHLLAAGIHDEARAYLVEQLPLFAAQLPRFQLLLGNRITFQ